MALAVNVTGSERLKPLVIHKTKRPRCFGKTFDPNNLVTYYSNKKGWMRTEVKKRLPFIVNLVLLYMYYEVNGAMFWHAGIH